MSGDLDTAAEAEIAPEPAVVLNGHDPVPVSGRHSHPTTVVPLRAFTEDDALAFLRERGKLTVAATQLAQQWGWPARRVQRKLADWEAAGLIRRKGKRITVRATAIEPSENDKETSAETSKSDMTFLPESVNECTAAFPVESTAAAMAFLPPARPAIATRCVAIILGAVALGLAAIAIQINMDFGFSLGRSPYAATLFASLAVANDALALLLPSVSMALWQAARYATSMAAWGIWCVTLAMAIMAGAGFVGLNVADVTTARTTALTATASPVVAAAQQAVNAATTNRDEECKRVGPNCRRRVAELVARQDELRQAVADEAARNDAKVAQLADP
ncbi:MAG TPA: helix-turn-helix domain-containing protein [Xanthobacteraceae bacterium]